MSKVILLSGSPNKNGNTVRAFNEMAKVIQKSGVDAEVISLAGMNLKDAMNGRGGYNDGFDEIIDKIAAAEGLIVGGPVYWGTVRAELMTALQRIGVASTQNGNFLSRKIGGPVAFGNRGGLTSSLQEMMMFFLAADMIIPGSTYWNIAFGDALEDEMGMNTLKRFAENTAWLIKKTKQNEPENSINPSRVGGDEEKNKSDRSSENFHEGRKLVDKIRYYGRANHPIPNSVQYTCSCGKEFTMVYFEEKCPACGNVHGIAPCSPHIPKNVKAAGINY